MFFSLKKCRFVFVGLVFAFIVICAGFTSNAQEENNSLQNDENGIIQNNTTEVYNTKMNSLEEQGNLNKTGESEYAVVQKNEALQQNDVVQDNNNKQIPLVSANDSINQQEKQLAANDSQGYYYNPDSYLTPDQRTALLTVSTNDTSNIQRAYFRVWTGDGRDMRGFDAYLQSDGRWMSFVPVSLYGQSGRYNCLATVVFNDGHEENLGFVFFEVEKPIVGSVSMQNVNEHEGTFDIVISDISCPSGVESIDVIAFTRQDLSDAYIYSASNIGNGTFVVKGNVFFHNFNYGNYGIVAVVKGGNGVKGDASCGGSILMPETKLGAFSIDNNVFFLIADNTPYDSLSVGTDFYVWHDGLSDMRRYSGFRDGNRWLSIISVADYGKSGNYIFAAKGKMFTGAEFDFGASMFGVSPSHVDGVNVFNPNNEEGTFFVKLDGIKGLGGYRSVKALVFTQPDWSDAFCYGGIDCGNGVYIIGVDVAMHKFHYGIYGIAPIVTNGFGADELTGITYFNLEKPATVNYANPNYRQTAVSLGSSHLPSKNHILGIKYYVWSSGNDIHCYSTCQRDSSGTFTWDFSMGDYKTTGVFFVRPQIVRDNYTEEDLDLYCFAITKDYYQKEVLEVKKEANFFNTINEALDYAKSIGYDLLHKIDILINPGTYTEKISLVNKHGISLIGTDKNSCIIEEYTTYPDCIVNAVGDVTFKNLTIRTTGGFTYAVHSDGQGHPDWGGNIIFDNCVISGGTNAIGYGASANSSLHVRNCELYGCVYGIYAHNCPYAGNASQWLTLDSNVFKINPGNVAVKFDDASSCFGTSDSFLYVNAINNRYEGDTANVLAGTYPEKESNPTIDYKNRYWAYPVILYSGSSGNSNIPALNA